MSHNEPPMLVGREVTITPLVPRWEYLVAHSGEDGLFLEAAGQDGWELVNVQPSRKDNRWMYWLKRPIWDPPQLCEPMKEPSA